MLAQSQSGRYGGSSSGQNALSGVSGFGGCGMVGASPMHAGVVAPAKKKDPYATAWRTYSKIAEELQLLNPDGSLYPISKEAILKYLHHQSRRIKSSNLHWYVNGLKKHQENMGIPWDDVRYDEQVVALLKELTLHPVMMGESHGGSSSGAGVTGGMGDEDGGHYGYGSHRQRQSSSGVYPLGAGVGGGRTGGHHHSSSSIDTTRIANLTISQPPPSHSQQQQPQQQQKQQQQQQQQQPQHGQSFVNAGLKQHHQNHQQFLQQQQQAHHHSQRIQQPPPPKPYYHSAPIQLPTSSSSSSLTGLHARTPSTQELVHSGASGGGGGGMHQSRSGGLQPQLQQHQQGPPSSSSVGMSHELRSEPMINGAHVSSALSKRKRDDFAFKKRRMPSSMSMEGDEDDEDELHDDDFRDEDDEDLDTRRGEALLHRHHHNHDPDDSDEMEDSNRYQPLKRRASTGTLLNQVRASAVKHVPGPFAEGPTNNPSTTTSQGQRTLHHRVSSSGLSGAANKHHNLQSRRSHQNLHHHHSSSQHQHQHHLRSPSPESRDGASHYSQNRRDIGSSGRVGGEGRDTSVDLTSSNARHQRQHSSSMTESSDSKRFRHPSSNSSSSGGGGLVGATFADTSVPFHRAPLAVPLLTPTSTAPAAVPTRTPTTPTAGKMTVQFSNVVECAQMLYDKYKGRCKDHPLGCVEITEDRHLELTMKMYLDWAGLVVSE
ncbi:hypothetical protein BGW39_000944 [Mortierella sp. 14UC]|nr:hypothetical protein BGW39_000944 [Mortierella sp. 14UC]